MGEEDQLMGDNGNEVEGLNQSGPNVVGTVIDVDFYSQQKWAYTISFPSITPRPPGSSEPQDVVVTIDQYGRDCIDNTLFYRVLELGKLPADRKKGWPSRDHDMKYTPSMLHSTE
jgi:hypothetical protein